MGLKHRPETDAISSASQWPGPRCRKCHSTRRIAH
jgi:hypothetical protein